MEPGARTRSQRPAERLEIGKTSVPSGWRLWSLVSLIIIVTYPLSFGPAVGLIRAGYRHPRIVARVYNPLGWISVRRFLMCSSGCFAFSIKIRSEISENALTFDLEQIMQPTLRTDQMVIRYSAVVLLLLSVGLCATGLGDDGGREFKPPEYRVLRAGTPICIDGKLDEPAWIAAPDAGEFHFTWFKEGRKEQSIAKLLWDDESLYVAHICEDAHITARHTDRDGKIPEDDCFEVIFAPNPEKPNVYFNIEWNVIGGFVDNHRPNGPKQPRAPKWDAEGVKIVGNYVGTLNDDSDTDKYWIVEAAIPFKNFADFMPNPVPRAGSTWNLNFNRHGGVTNPQYSQWSRADTPVPNFHTPDRFGRVIFAAETSPFGRAGEVRTR